MSRAVNDVCVQIDEEFDFIVNKESENSLKKFLTLYPNGVSNSVISKCLQMKEPEIETFFAAVIAKLQRIALA